MPQVGPHYFSPAQHLPYTSNTKVPVETVSGWRKQAKAEEDAGLRAEKYSVQIPLYSCDLCGICVGPGYYEQELYLYPVYRQHECCIDTRTYFEKSTWLHICGGCAHRRSLPAILCMVKPQYWETTELLCGEGEAVRAASPANEIEQLQIRRALRTHLLTCYQFFLALLCVRLGISLVRVAKRAPLRQVGKARQASPSTQKPLLYFSSPLSAMLQEDSRKRAIL